MHRQILQPAILPQHDPVTGKELPLMPAKLVTGEDARDVAAYVASAAAQPGKDTGALAQVGGGKAKGTATEKNGELDIPADPSGALAYTFANATAKPGQVTIKSQNKASIDHDIVDRGQRRRRERARSSRTAARRRSRSTSSPATTRSTARCPATARAAWKASSRSSEQRLALARLVAVRFLRRLVEEVTEGEDHDEESTVTIRAPAICWSASAEIPNLRSPDPYTPV